jgi:hypothetical protein
MADRFIYFDIHYAVEIGQFKSEVQHLEVFQ